MTEAYITGAAAILVCMVNNYFQNKRFEKQYNMQVQETQDKHEETISLINYRLQKMEEKQDKHNNLIERVFNLEKKTSINEEKIKVANHRIDDLERSV